MVYLALIVAGILFLFIALYQLCFGSATSSFSACLSVFILFTVSFGTIIVALPMLLLRADRTDIWQ